MTNTDSSVWVLHCYCRRQKIVLQFKTIRQVLTGFFLSFFSPHLKNSKRAEHSLSFSPVLAFHSRQQGWHLHATGFPTVQPIRKGIPRRACWWGGRGHYPVSRESRQSFCHCKCKSVNTLRSSHSGMPQADSFSPSQSQSVCVADDFYVYIFPSSFIPFFAR